MAASELDVFEARQNVELLDLMDRQKEELRGMLMRKHGQVKPVQLLMTISGIVFINAEEPHF